MMGYAEQARAAANDYFPLLQLGRAAEARDLLRRCRDVFEAANDIPALGKTLTALAHAESELGHLDRAIDLEKDALRFKYLAADPDAIRVSHHNLARYLDRAGANRQQVWAHRLAATVIAYQAGSGRLTPAVRGLARLLAADGPSAAPRSYPRVREIADQIQGVHLDHLLARLPRRAPTPKPPSTTSSTSPPKPPPTAYFRRNPTAYMMTTIYGMSIAEEPERPRPSPPKFAFDPAIVDRVDEHPRRRVWA